MIDLAPTYTTATQPQFVPIEENIGILGNIKDGSTDTVYGFTLYNSPVEGPQFPWYGNYHLTFNGSYYVDTIRIVHSRGSIKVDNPAGWIDSHEILCTCLTEENTVLTVCVTNLYSAFDNTYDVKTRVKEVRVTMNIDGHSGRIGSISAYLHNVYINGIGVIGSPIKIKTLSGNVTLAKETEVFGTLRYMNDSGIESLALVPVDDPKASNVRIKTVSGIKAIAKI